MRLDARKESTVSVQALLSSAWAMYKRHFAAMTLSSLIIWAVCLVFLLIFFSVMGLIFGILLRSFALALLLFIVVGAEAFFVVDVMGVTFAGGQYRMLILAEREGRVARVADLWSALRFLPSFIAWAAFMDGLGILALIVLVFGAWLDLKAGSSFITVVAGITVVVFVYWLAVRWVWVIPSIGDSGMGLLAAMRRSSLIVSRVGWWRTFGLLLIVICINLFSYVVTTLVLNAAGDILQLPRLLTAWLALVPLIVFAGAFETCLLTVMYRHSQVAASLADTFSRDAAPSAGTSGSVVQQATGQLGEALRYLKGERAAGQPGLVMAPSEGLPTQDSAVGGASGGAQAASYSAFCSRCGAARVVQSRFCRQCGASLERGPHA